MLGLPEKLSDCANALAKKRKEIVKAREDSGVLSFHLVVLVSKKDSNDILEIIQQGQDSQAGEVIVWRSMAPKSDKPVDIYNMVFMTGEGEQERAGTALT